MAKSTNTSTGPYEDPELDELYTSLTGRAPFRYSAEGDPLYRAARAEARQGGELAMRHTVGAASALTGGYGSSYAQTAGQQQYDAYLQSLARQLPQYYSAALERYQAEGKALREAYDLARDRQAQAQARQRQEESAAQSEEQRRYSRQKDRYQQLYRLIYATGYKPTDAELKTAGMTRAEAKALQQAYARAQTGK